jgi:apolipoprotein N-acyltransferase
MKLNFALLITGALLTCAFAPFGIWPLALICPAVLLWSWQRAGSPKTAFCRGLLFGFGFFATSVSWVYVSMNYFGGMGIFSSLMATLLFALILSLFFAMPGWIFAKLCTYKPIPVWAQNFLLFPVLLMAFELIRSYCFTGFPWMLLGYSQTASPLSGFAPLGSVYLVSLVCYVLAGALAWRFVSPAKQALLTLLCLFLAAFGIGFWASHHGFTHKDGLPLKVTLVQGNIAQSTKWVLGINPKIQKKYLRLTHQKWAPIVIWPENAIPEFPRDAQAFLARLQKTALKHHSALLLGLPLDNPVTGHYYNGAMVLGSGHGVYFKRHLVPFGEYVPFHAVLGQLFQFLSIPMSNFSPGPAVQASLDMQNTPVALLICYETAYANLARTSALHATVLAAISDDSWFGDSLGPLQHEQIAQMRALETGRPILRDTNSGITSIINAKGDIVKRIPGFKAAVLTGQVQPMSGLTPWVRYGWWILVVIMLLMLAPTLVIICAKKD